MQIAGKRIVLTGAASGIGKALIPALIERQPAHLILVDVNGEALAEAARTHQGSVPITTVTADLSQQDGVDHVFEVAIGEMGEIDCFIANAGFAYYEEYNGDWDHLDAIFRVNVLSPLHALHRLRQLRASSTDPYSFVITASAMGRLAYPGYAVYGATKAALDRFAEGYRFEKPAHEHVMLVYPISTRTGFFQRAQTSGKPTPVALPAQTPEYVARRVIAGLERGAASVVPSPLFILSSLIHRVVPVLKIPQYLALRQFRAWQKELE